MRFVLRCNFRGGTVTGATGVSVLMGAVLMATALLVGAVGTGVSAANLRTDPAAGDAVPPATPGTVMLRLPQRHNGDHTFFHALLTRAFQDIGIDAVIEPVAAVPRLRMNAWLDEGVLTAIWFLPTDARRARFLEVPLGLTGGLIGQRVLLIRPEDRGRFAAVRSLADLRALGVVGGFGRDWFDSIVWRMNGLPVYEERSEWTTLFRLVANGRRGVDYLSRSVIEVAHDAARHPGLLIEPGLLLVYARDYFFYVSPRHADLLPLVTRALHQAIRSGLRDRLIDRFFGGQLAALDVAGRHRIDLSLPRAAVVTE